MPLSLIANPSLSTSPTMKDEFVRGERVVIIKSGPLRDKTGTILLADHAIECYCVKLDEPVGSRKLAIISKTNLMQAL